MKGKENKGEKRENSLSTTPTEEHLYESLSAAGTIHYVILGALVGRSISCNQDGYL